MSILIKQLGPTDYLEAWQAMQDFTDRRDHSTADEIWITEHPAVFTQGLNGKAEHILQASDIPIVQSDRGGQITYHGPGQLIVYVMIDLKRANLGVRALVSELENVIIQYLQSLGIESSARKDAPGVYVNNQKIASLGLKIRKNRSYHGLALNIDMDLSPFSYINPCGLEAMQMTQIKSLLEDGSLPTLSEAGEGLSKLLSKSLSQATKT
jgi:lipoyl(octanoyl) transferase